MLIGDTNHTGELSQRFFAALTVGDSLRSFRKYSASSHPGRRGGLFCRIATKEQSEIVR
jgi:hypothetical protein